MLPHLLYTDDLLSLQLGQLTGSFNSLKPHLELQLRLTAPRKQWRKRLLLKVTKLVLFST